MDRQCQSGTRINEASVAAPSWRFIFQSTIDTIEGSGPRGHVTVCAHAPRHSVGMKADRLKLTLMVPLVYCVLHQPHLPSQTRRSHLTSSSPSRVTDVIHHLTPAVHPLAHSVSVMSFTRAFSLAAYLICGLICCSYLLGAVSAATDEVVTKKSGAGKGSLITINEDDWEQILSGEWMVEFHAPWCPACRALQPEWKSFSGWSSELGIKVGAVDVTANPGLSGRFLVTALPTIYHVKDGLFRQYKGTRDTNSFVSFVEEKKWQSIEPVTNWKAPDSVQMSFVSNLFKISMALRSVHNSLVEDYGIPYWGSYIVFAFATILFGAILGLLIVCVIDIIWPAKLNEIPVKDLPRSQQNPSAQKDAPSDDNVEDDLGDSDKSSGAEEPAASEEQTTDDDQATGTKKGLRKRRARKDGN